MKFVGIGLFSQNSLNIYNNTEKSVLEKIEECDLIRFLDQGIKVKMIEVKCENVSVDTPKDLEYVRYLINKKNKQGEKL